MNSYDDLQRFKEKTQTNHIEFKDMSEQTLNSTTTNWAIIKQLLNEGAGSVLDNSQRIDRAVPQPVDFAAFTSSSVENAPAISSLPVQSFVPATPDASDRVGASLLDSISASLQPAAASAEAVEPTTVKAPAAEPAPLRAMPVAQQTAVSGSSLLAQLAVSTAPAPQPAAVVPAQPVFQAGTAHVPQAVDAQPVMPAHSPAVEAPANVSYKQLFSTAAAPGSAALPKDMLLHPLLEKIASCR
ncbi:cellulose biosynthesis protein BcsO [Erwinia rhapontici]|uniref:cellulose biosynthesis protein BcsO n=1 Tax=Erwinia rhapontici TaxID=55212 RepID=UPI002169C01F|nr:cellulose biosynthesis protein BcsO [Erwinia rhapontici]